MPSFFRTLAILLLVSFSLTFLAALTIMTIGPQSAKLQLVSPVSKPSLFSPSPTLRPPAKVTLVTTGDVMLGRSVNVETVKRGDPLYPFRPTQSVLADSDLALINLENPLYDPCPTREGGMVFCAPTKSVEALIFAGIDIANIANNHTLNYDKEGYESTINTLLRHSIQPSDSERLAIIEKQGTKFGFLGFDFVSINWTTSQVTEKIAAADDQVDVLVVSVHRGAEYTAGPTPAEKGQLRAMVDAGADLVIGHHPHVVQPVEIYGGVPIIYSLGNFVFDQMWSEATREGVIGKFTFTGSKLSDYEFIPVYIDKIGQPKMVTDKDHSAAILSRLSGLGYSVQNSDNEDAPENDARK